ncbi:MAG: SDR family NAD(P)-dependent oxidoreductase [Chloroflexi bacterium]|nr:SDR family NAD(P)-dependent oxidoreductase [Chloroflexota bacterium]
MQELAGKTAVVTGAASGIGFALAERLAEEGMRIVIADVEAPALAEASEKLTAAGATVLPVQTDVSKWKEVEALAGAAFDEFGAVHVLCNNAGVGGAGGQPLWEQSIETWQWVLGVNLWGVVYGVHAFVPRMVAGGEEGHVVNTASMAGLLGGSGIYGVSKHGVVALSEALHQQFVMANTKLRVSVVCPGFINTNIIDSTRNKPANVEAGDDEALPPAVKERMEFMRQRLASGYAPSVVAEAVLDAIRGQRLYVLPAQDELKGLILPRAENIANERNP